jgi:hypothetical protein
MTSSAIATTIDHKSPLGINSQVMGLGALAVLWCFSLWFTLQIPASWDVAWRLEIARRIVDGAILYQDIVEVNPPLWFWAAIPSVKLAQFLGVSSFTVLCVLIYLLLVPALWLLSACLQPFVERRERYWLLAGALVGLMWPPMLEFGQREPPVLLASLLWGAIAVRRALGHPCPPWLIMGCTAFAAYGFALKHYYLIVPIGIEIWLIYQLKKAWRPFRFETILLAALGGAYAVAVVKLAPAYFTETIPLIRLSYDEVRSVNVANPWLHPVSMLGQSLVLIAPFYFVRDIIKAKPIAQVLLLSIILHTMAVWLQGKGFANHFLAAKGVTVALWGYVFATMKIKSVKAFASPALLAALVTIGGIALPIARVLIAQSQPARPGPSAVATELSVVQTLASQPKSARIFVASTNAGLSFFALWEQDRQHYSRYFAMWMLPGLIASSDMPQRQQGTKDMLNEVRADTIADIKCAAPTMIIGDTTYHGRRKAGEFETYAIKPMDFLKSDQAFNIWLNAHYTSKPETNGMTVWTAKQPLTLKPANCA